MSTNHQLVQLERCRMGFKHLRSIVPNYWNLAGERRRNWYKFVRIHARQTVDSYRWRFWKSQIIFLSHYTAKSDYLFIFRQVSISWIVSKKIFFQSLCHQYGGHSSHVTTVSFLHDDTRLISTGGMDTSVLQWSLEWNYYFLLFILFIFALFQFALSIGFKLISILLTYIWISYFTIN